MFLGLFFGITEDKMLTVLGFLLMFYNVASGLQSEDSIVCRFTENDTCYVARGQQVHLPIPPGNKFNLLFGNRNILRKTASNTPTPNPSRWLFDIETNTMILTSAEWSDSGTYILETFDAEGTLTGKYTFQIYMKDFRVFVSLWLFEMIILLSLLVGANLYTRISRKQRMIKNQEAL